MAKGSKILRKAIKRLRASGLTWQEVAAYYGGSRASAYLIATGKWEPSEGRAEEIMRDLPRHLWKTSKEQEGAVLAEIRNHHTGMKSAIKSRYLALQLGIEERMIRSCVNSLRKQGYPVCSSVGKHPGFYWPFTRQEYEAFKHRDYLSRIKDMQHVVDAMDMGADRHFAGQRIEMEMQPELM